MLPDLAIKEFIEAYKKQYGVILSFEEAKLLSQNFYLFFKSISNEISKQNKNTNLILKGGE